MEPVVIVWLVVETGGAGPVVIAPVEVVFMDPEVRVSWLVVVVNALVVRVNAPVVSVLFADPVVEEVGTPVPLVVEVSLPVVDPPVVVGGVGSISSGKN